MKIGENIKYLRERINMSQTELADRLHTTKQTIYKYENGIVTNIPSDRIELLAQILQCTPSYLMGWEELYDDLTLSPTEKQVIVEYRKADEVTKEMVHRVLHIEEKRDSERMA